MADKNIEINVSILDGVHNSLIELAQNCSELGVQINYVSFNWLYNSQLTGQPIQPVLISVDINSSKVKD